MPAIKPPATVLVTGANGYIGLWIVRELLLRGYAVQGAVRTVGKADDMASWLTQKYPAVASRYQSFIVPDITVEGAYDEAVKGTQAIVHTASPVDHSMEDPQGLIHPAVDGTLSLLKSALAAGCAPTVKRIVITASTGSIASTEAPARTYTEDDWNDASVEWVDREGKNAPGEIKYNAAKTLGERAAWKFLEDNKDTASFDLCVLQPSWVHGPIANDTLPSPEKLSPTSLLLWYMVFVVPPPPQAYPDWIWNYVDIRDITEMHIKALEVEEAGGQRFVANSEQTTWEECVNIVKRLNVLPGLEKVERPPHREYGPAPWFANEKAKRILGVQFRTLPETMKDLVEQYRSLGWLKHLEA
ncbi:NAD-P-binding protein [Trametes punicea]|nr:NAD-P-binding protein [Trametes punicea]